MKLTWGKPKVEIAISQGNGALPTSWIKVPTIKKGTAQMSTTQSSPREIRGEGGILIARKQVRGTRVFVMELFIASGEDRPINTIDGVIKDPYALMLTPEDETLTGFTFVEAHVEEEELWNSAEGSIVRYTFTEIHQSNSAPAIPTTITSVENQSRSVPFGTPYANINRPTTVKTFLSNGSSRNLAVSWGAVSPAYNSGQNGVYNVTGDITLITNVTNPQNIKAQLAITVEPEVSVPLTVASVSPINISVPFGTTRPNAGLPETATVTLSDSTTRSIGVTIGAFTPTYNGNTAGIYNATGSLVMPAGITNPNNVTVPVRVNIQANDNNERQAFIDLHTPNVGKNLIRNSSFIFDEIYWEQQVATTDEVTVENGVATFHGDRRVFSGVTFTQNEIPALPNTEYTLSFLIETENIVAPCIFTCVTRSGDASGTTLYNAIDKISIQGTTPKTRISVTFTTLADTTVLNIKPQLYKGAGGKAKMSEPQIQIGSEFDGYAYNTIQELEAVATNKYGGGTNKIVLDLVPLMELGVVSPQGDLSASTIYNRTPLIAVNEGDIIDYNIWLKGLYVSLVFKYDANGNFLNRPIQTDTASAKHYTGSYVVESDVKSIRVITMNSTHSDYVPFELLITHTRMQLNIGTENAIEKIDNLIALSWTALEDIPNRDTPIAKGTINSGVNYSSARRHDKFVGSYISVQTYLSALMNKNSVIYTENLAPDELGFAYYGTVCSAMLAYAIGLKGAPFTNHWRTVEGMNIISNVDNMEPADLLLLERGTATGHLVMVYSVTKIDGVLISFTTVETTSTTAIKKGTMTRQQHLDSGYIILRYADLDKNKKDVFNHDFSAEAFFNIDLGNKSNYKLGEAVKFSRFADSSYTHIVGTLNGSPIPAMAITGEITESASLVVGDYSIALSKGATPTSITPYMQFKVVDSTASATMSGNTATITFGSEHGTAVWVNWNTAGTVIPMQSRAITESEAIAGVLTDTFVNAGISGNAKIKIYFENEFGTFTSDEIDVTVS